VTHTPSGALPPDVLRRVAPARKLARETGIALYLVGGAVRDLLLGRAVTDVDLVVEADALGFAARLARELGAAVELHRRFGTAVLSLPDGERLDVATARAEEYQKPAALPRVRASSIEDDLARRDFTINAMALEIARSKRAALLDPFGGRNDLRRKLVRALHPRSFDDDPTRAFRAVRYANRLGFRIESATRAAIRAAVAAGAVNAVSGDRLRREILLLFTEPNRASAARAMATLGLSRTIHPALSYDAAVGARVRRAERLATEAGRNATWLVYLLSWMGESSAEVADAIARRLNLSSAPSRTVRAWPAAWKALSRAGDRGVAALAERIEGLGEDALLAAAATAPAPLARRILSIRDAAPAYRLTIRGKDLVAAGIPPGPAIGRALSATISARRDGAIRPEQELAFALKAARS
jgi:tRNA nucleotidyltransferase (CCA-adding enzyme)